MGNLKDLLERANPFLLLSISIAAELCGTTSMKVSHGFSDPLFTALTICAYALAFSLFTIVLKKVPLGLAYGIWGGVGTVGTAAIGIVAWGDPFGWATAAGIALVVGGIALLNVIPKVQALLSNYAGDAKTGVQIILRALEEPIRQIAANAGIDGSVIVENIKNAKKPGYGFDALKGEYVDMIERGIIDPTKVTRSALQNAASVAAMVLTTESLVADIPAPEPAAPAGGAGGMGGMY